MRRRSKWSGERDQALIRLYEYGVGLEEMADELGIDPQSVNQRLRELDRQPRAVRLEEEDANPLDFR